MDKSQIAGHLPADDRDKLLSLVTALDASLRALRRDVWRGEGAKGDWGVRGRRGHIYPDGDGFLLYVTIDEGGERQPSSVRWSLAKRRLGFCRVTQDGDWEGCLRLDRLPAAAEAATIRDVLRIKRQRRLSPEDRERRADRARRLQANVKGATIVSAIRQTGGEEG